jgi:hypothetical protein
MFFLPGRPEFQLGATFRGDLPLDPNNDAVGFGPAGLVNGAYQFLGDPEDTFQLVALVGIGGGVFYHRVPYRDCTGVIADETSGHPQYPSGITGEETLCDPDSLEPGPDGELTWDMASGEDRAYFRKAGYFVGELGLDSYVWFNEFLGLNFGVVADVLAPEFAVNFDVQAGLAVRL